MKKTLEAYKRWKVRQPSYITAKLEDLAHEMSVCTWIFYSPSSTEEERRSANRRLRRNALRVARYHLIQEAGGMDSYLARHYDERRFLDFVESAEMMRRAKA